MQHAPISRAHLLQHAARLAGIFEEVQARALNRALTEQLDDAMRSGNLNKASMAQRMATSRFQLDRVLGPGNLSIQLDTRPASFRSFKPEVQGFALVVTLPSL